MLATLFWISFVFIFYAYVGYPLLLKSLSLFRQHPVRRRMITPRVSLIITAYNEERRIEAKLQNALALTYPKDKIEIIVASDCSSDKTDEIVRAYQSYGVRLVRAPERKGKENAQRHALLSASGEILVFSDVATILEPEGITNIVKNFSDPSVGCVSSVDLFIDQNGKISGEGAYVRYEMFLRDLESRVHSIVGLSGSFFAARREVCLNWAVNLQSDFNTLLNSIRAGLRGVSDSSSIGYYKNIADEKKEFERKVRTVLRGITVFMSSLTMLNPFRYRLFSWQLFSHKLCRWLVPFAMLSLCFSNIVLAADSVFYLYALLFQTAFYGVAFAGMAGKRHLNSTFLKIPSFFVLVNWAILNAWLRYIGGERMIAWKPSER